MSKMDFKQMRESGMDLNQIFLKIFELPIDEQILAIAAINSVVPSKPPKKKKVLETKVFNYQFHQRPFRHVASDKELSYINDYRKCRMSLDFAKQIGSYDDIRNIIIEKHKFGKVFVGLYEDSYMSSKIVFRHMAFIDNGSINKPEINKKNNRDKKFRIGRSANEIKAGCFYGHEDNILAELYNSYDYVSSMLNFAKQFGYYHQAEQKVFYSYKHWDIFLEIYNSGDSNHRLALVNYVKKINQ